MRLFKLFCLTLLATAVSAHSLWVFADAEQIDVIFEHAMQPGEGGYNRDILANGNTWVRRPGSDRRAPVELRETGPEGRRHLVGRSGVASPRVIEHECLFGIYNGRLDYFYGKFLDVRSVSELEALAVSEEHPIDIVPSSEGKGLSVRVLWHGKPLANHRIAVMRPDGSEEKLRTDESGRLDYEPSQAGRYGFWSVLVNDETEGEHEGEPYNGTMHAATMSLVWPLAD